VFLRVLLGTNRLAAQLNFGSVRHWAPENLPKLQEAVTTGIVPDEVLESTPALRDIFRRDPLLQSLFVFDAATGKQPYIPVHDNSGTLNGPAMPPCVCPDGFIVSAITCYYPVYCRMNPDTGDLVDFIHPYLDPGGGEHRNHSGAMNNDENAGYSSSRDEIFFSHWDGLGQIGGGGAFRLKTERLRIRPGAINKGAQLEQPRYEDAENKWVFNTSNSDPGANAFAIADNHLVWNSQGWLFAWSGQAEGGINK